MQLVIPMAGLGQRFADVGYAVPKPLIPVGGVPMVVRVVRNLPPAERVVFIAHPDHVRRFPVRELLAAHVPGSVVVVAPGLTAGQACSVRLAADELDLEDEVLVAACDSTQTYDAAKFAEATRDADAVIWVFRNDPRVLVKPTAYGWVRDIHGRVVEVSVKVPLSESPLADGVVSGTFWFRSGDVMLDGIDALVASNARVNGEFYMDSVPNVLLARGQVVRSFEMDKYIGWGTPDDLADYQKWERHFAARAA